MNTYCQAQIERHYFSPDKIIFEREDHELKFDVKTTFHWYDRLYAYFFGNSWASLRIRDRDQNLSEVDIYVRINDLVQFLSISPKEIAGKKSDDLGKLFKQKRIWIKKAGQILKQTGLTLSQSEIKELQDVCQRIELCRQTWMEQLRNSGAGFLKVGKKDSLLAKSIYIVAKENSAKIGIFIHLGKQKYTIGKGLFKRVTMAINFEKWKIVALAKTNYRELVDHSAAEACSNREVAVMKRLPIHPALLRARYMGQKLKELNGDMFKQNYILVKYCELGSLAKNIPTLSPIEIKEIMLELCDGLNKLHENFRHQDLKPDNCLLYKDKKTGLKRPKIMDFGLTVTGNDSIGGDDLYTAPEKLLNYEVASVPEEIWSLGLSFYMMIYGMKDWTTFAAKFPDLSHRSLAYKHKHSADSQLARGPLLKIILKMMDPCPEDRIPLTDAKQQIQILGEQDFVPEDAILALNQTY